MDCACNEFGCQDLASKCFNIGPTNIQDKFTELDLGNPTPVIESQLLTSVRSQKLVYSDNTLTTIFMFFFMIILVALLVCMLFRFIRKDKDLCWKGEEQSAKVE